MAGVRKKPRCRPGLEVEVEDGKRSWSATALLGWHPGHAVYSGVGGYPLGE